MGSENIKDIVLNFNKKLNELLNVLICLAKTEKDRTGFDRIKKRIQLAKQLVDEKIVISTAGQYMNTYKDQIMRRDTEFIFSVDVNAECKRLNVTVESDDENKYILDLFDSMRTACKNISAEEKNILANMVFDMYREYLKFVVMS